MKKWPFILGLICLISLIGTSVKADPGELKPTPQPTDDMQARACALLDDPVQRSLMSGGLEMRLLDQCGRKELIRPDIGSIQPPQILSGGGDDVLVNDPMADRGFSTTQSEVSVAVRPSDGLLCAGWNDSQHIAIGAQTSLTGYATSVDGGATWLDGGALPPIPGHKNYGDPDVDYSVRERQFYYVTLDSKGLALHVSRDGCKTFNRHIQVHEGLGDDKELMAIDNWRVSPRFGRIYIVWKDFFDGGLLKATYSDDGFSWSEPVNLHPNDGRFTQGAWPTVAHNGDVYVSWVRWTGPFGSEIDIEVVRSTDGGKSFQPVTNPLKGAVNPRHARASSSCNRQALNGYIRYLPSPQIEADERGVLHIVYSYDPDGQDRGDVVDVFYRQSRDQGATWSPEVRLNDDRGKNDQFFPSLVVNRNGTVGVYWYDRREDSDNLEFHMFRTISENNGLSWEENVQLSDVASQVPPILPNFDPKIRNCYMGDYNEGDGDASNLYMIWSDNRNIQNGHPDPDVWFERVELQDKKESNTCRIVLLDDSHDCDRVPAVSFLRQPARGQAVLRVNLDPKKYGYDRVTFELGYLGKPPGFSFNLGDSRTNDGGGGDKWTQSNDAELMIFDGDLYVYGNDKIPLHIRNILSLYGFVEGRENVTLEVRNQYLGWEGGELRSHYLFALDGQPDSEGPVNYDIFVGLNRTIYRPSRTGSGLAWVRLTLSGPED